MNTILYVCVIYKNYLKFKKLFNLNMVEHMKGSKNFNEDILITKEALYSNLLFTSKSKSIFVDIF